ncbi:MAG: ABC transporter permease [Acidobacteria bacterium]|nr:ABC transporter permease [Acidobacteriota bacterium]MYC83559.1 ABC transporter permease [Acidobacteriota bacterium]
MPDVIGAKPRPSLEQTLPPADAVETGPLTGAARDPEASVPGATPPLPEASRYRPVNPLLELTLARIREFVREPEAVFWVFVFPVLLAVALGIAFRETGPATVQVAVEADGRQGPGSGSGRLMDWLEGRSDIEAVLLSPEEAARALRTGRVALVLRPARSEAAASGNPAAGETVSAPSPLPDLDSEGLVYRYDPTRPDSRVARLVVDDALQRGMGREDVAQMRDEAVAQPGARYIDFLIPGLVGLNLMGSGMWGLGFAVVQARTRKLLKLLAATPMRRTHFLLSFMLSRLIFLALEVVAVISFGWVAFGVSVHGSILELGVISLVGSMSFAGLGLLVAARTRTIEGVSGLMNLVMLPMWLLSGTFFAATRFPEFWQPVIQVLPLTALNDALRANINEGLPLAASLPDVLVMAAWGIVSFLLALRWFRWQ